MLLAACHAENTLVCLQNTEPKRTNLEKMIVTTVSAKSKVFLWFCFALFFVFALVTDNCFEEGNFRIFLINKLNVALPSEKIT